MPGICSYNDLTFIPFVAAVPASFRESCVSGTPGSSRRPGRPRGLRGAPDVHVVELVEVHLIDAHEGAADPLLPQETPQEPGHVGVHDDDEGSPLGNRPGEGLEEPAAQLAQRRVPGAVTPVDGEGKPAA